MDGLPRQFWHLFVTGISQTILNISSHYKRVPLSQTRQAQISTWPPNKFLYFSMPQLSVRQRQQRFVLSLQTGISA